MTQPSISAAAPAGLLDGLGDRLEEVSSTRRILDDYEAVAERLCAAGRWEDAASAVATVAFATTTRHPGVLTSVRLERVLADIARACLAPLAPRPRSDPAQRVLHVATEMYGVGGHTRVLWRWIARDRARSHTLVTTAQRVPVVEGVRQAVSASGGTLVSLDPSAPWLERASRLRELAADFDVVVLHIHHHDVVPTLAFSGAGARPPVVLFNHADHMFWLGASVVDAVYCSRQCPATALRGIPAERCVTGPFPVTGPDDEHSDGSTRAAVRAEVLAHLGWPEDACVLVSVGAAKKYAGSPGTTLLELALPVLHELPQARLLAVGPPDDGEFRRARFDTGGRVAGLGTVVGVGRLLDAADVYLETRPVGGPGSSAEGAFHGLPVLSYATSELEAGIVCTSPEYGTTLACSPADYQDRLRALITDPAHRERLGRLALETVRETDRGFESAIADLYRRAAELGPTSVDELSAPDEDDYELHAFVAAVELKLKSYDPVRPEVGLAAFELVERSPGIRSLYRSLFGGWGGPELGGRFACAFAAPPAEPQALRALIEEFRRLAALGLAERYLIALRPEDQEIAVPALEAALAGGADVDVDVTFDERPHELRPELSLEIVCGPGRPAEPDRAWLRCLPAGESQTDGALLTPSALPSGLS